MNAGRRTPAGGREGGQMVVVFAIVLLVLLGFAALGIDVGYMYSVRNDLQRSVDSGALAGAFVFHDGGWVSGSVPVSLQTKAEDRARNFVTRDPVGAAPLDNGAITIGFPDVNQIQVTAQANVNLFFAGLIGSPTVMLSATAIAEAIPVDQNVECLTPLAFPYPYTDSNGDGDWDSGEPYILPASIPQGWQVMFRVADTPSSGIPDYVMNGIFNPITGTFRGGAGEIFPIRMCGDALAGEPDLRLRIRTPCHDGCKEISIGDTVSLKGEGTYYATIDEIWVRFLSPGTGDDPFASWDSGSKLPVSTDARYSGDNWLLSPRVVRVMLYDPQVAKATGAITVERFAGFWIDWVPQPPPPIQPYNSYVRGYLVPDSAVGGTSDSPLLIEPSLKTTRLVQ